MDSQLCEFVIDGESSDSRTFFDGWGERQRIKRANSRATLVRFRTDAVVERSFTPVCAGTVTRTKGKVLGRPSSKSLQRLCFVLNNCDVPMNTMLTITMSSQVHRDNTVDVHKRCLKAALQRLRYRKSSTQYCWVREHQDNGNVHWHIFTDAITESPGKVDDLESNYWRRWMVNYYSKNGRISDRSRHFMRHGNGNDFDGCCRFERLLTNAAGRYAGKEGSKRYQKVSSKKWQRAGCAWWRCSGNIQCTPIDSIQVHPSKLEGINLVLDGEREVEVLFRVQRNKGLFPED